jgi:hypothetical protein
MRASDRVLRVWGGVGISKRCRLCPCGLQSNAVSMERSNSEFSMIRQALGSRKYPIAHQAEKGPGLANAQRQVLMVIKTKAIRQTVSTQLEIIKAALLSHHIQLG